MPAKTYPVFLPNLGPDLESPEEFLLDQVSPYSRNLEFKNGKLQTRGGKSKFSETSLGGRISQQFRFVKANGDAYNMFFTPKDIFAYDFNNSRFDILTPVYNTGVVKVVNGSAVVRGGLSVDNCDVSPVAWVDGSAGDVTPSRQTTSPQDGTAFVRLSVVAGAGVELLAYHDISSIDLSAYDSIGMWIRSSVALDAGDLQFLIDDTSACASALEAINIPAVSANTWTWVNLPIVTSSALTAVISIGIKQAVDKGAMTVDIDQIVAGDWSDKIGVGDYFKIGSTGIHTGATWYEVLTVDSDTQITLTAVYAGTSADQQTYAIRQIFTGGNSDDWSVTKFTDENLGDIVAAVNGVDGPCYWTGSGQVVFVTGLATDFTSAKFIASFKDMVVYSYTIEGGQNQPERNRWTAPGNIASMDDLHFEDLIDENGAITGSIIFGDYHITTKEKGFYIGRFIGGDEVFDWELSPSPVGTKSGRSLVKHAGWLNYFGSDKKFRRWNLVTDESIGDAVFPDTQNFDPNLEFQITGAVFAYRNQIRWFCPLNADGYNNHEFVWDFKKSNMYVWTCSQAQVLHSIGFYLLQSDLYLDDAIWGEYYLDEVDGYWDDSANISGAPTFIYGGYDGYVRICDIGDLDDGESYTRILRIKRLNFKQPHMRKRLWKQEWWFEQSATGEVSLSMYIDDANSAIPIGVISLANDDRDIVKVKEIIDRHGQNFQPEIQSTSFFALLGFLNDVFPGRRST